MTSTSHDAVTMQPQFGTNNQAIQQQQIDENGETIIMEGICAKKLVKDIVFSYYCSLSAAFCHLGSPCLLLAGKGCGSRAANSWQMYLTTSSIHLVDFNASCVCSRSNKRFDLVDIKDIEVVGSVYRGGCCNLGAKVAPATTILMELKPNRAKDFFILCCKRFDLPIVVAVNYCENATEFVEAVKNQMASLGLAI